MTTMEKNLRNSLENILFQEQTLKPVIKTLTALISDKTNCKKAVEVLIRTRFHLLEDILRFFSFHMTHQIGLKKIDTFADGPNSIKLEHELMEKNSFLEEIAQKVENICEKLEKR